MTVCPSIHTLVSSIAELPPDLRQIAERLYMVEHEHAGSSQITRVFNRWLHEGTSFDARRVRPVPGNEAIERLQEQCESDPECEFCRSNIVRLLERRPEARVQDGCLSLTPISRFARHHRVFFSAEHHPLPTRSMRAVIEQMFSCSERWALEEQDDRQSPLRFYFVAWNILCGSAIHGHIQASLTSAFAQASVEHLMRTRLDYAARYASDFFNDVAAVSDALGLAVRGGQAIAMPSLTPVKECEVWLLQPAVSPANLPEDLLSLMTRTMLRLADDGPACKAFNVAVAFPPLLPTAGWEGFPVFCRIVDRGWPLLGVPDWGAMEMFGTRIVANDPWHVAGQIK